MILICFISPAGDIEISVTALSGSLQYEVMSQPIWLRITCSMILMNTFNICETNKSSRYDKSDVTEKLPCLQNCESCLDVTEPSDTRL